MLATHESWGSNSVKLKESQDIGLLFWVCKHWLHNSYRVVNLPVLRTPVPGLPPGSYRAIQTICNLQESLKFHSWGTSYITWEIEHNSLQLFTSWILCTQSMMLRRPGCWLLRSKSLYYLEPILSPGCPPGPVCLLPGRSGGPRARVPRYHICSVIKKSNDILLS